MANEKTLHLYEAPAAYAAVFADDPADAEFFRALVGERGRVLDLGCGTSGLSARIGPAVGVDLSVPLLRSNPLRARIAGDIARLPFRDAAFDGGISRHLSVSYALASAGLQFRSTGVPPVTRNASSSPATLCVPGGGLDTGGTPVLQKASPNNLFSEIRRVLVPAGIIALDLAIAHRPRRLQGIEERAQLPGGIAYQFRYLDVICESEHGAVLASEINAMVDGRVYTLRDDVFVLTPNGVRSLLQQSGFEKIRFCAFGDVASLAEEPPADCLRAVVRAFARPSGPSLVPPDPREP